MQQKGLQNILCVRDICKAENLSKLQENKDRKGKADTKRQTKEIIDCAVSCLGVKTENGEYEYRIRPEENIYHMDFEKYMINFGYSKEGHEQVTLQFWGSGILNLDDWMLWCQPMDDYAADVNALKEDALENIVMENNQIRGTISTEKEKLLTFSIPYQKGWSATVDGVKVPLLKTNIMYTGLEISPGEHTVILQYEMPGIRYGLIVTGISTGIFICILIGFGLRKRKKVKSTK